MKSFKMKVIVSLAIAVFAFCNNTFAQDKIYKKHQATPIEVQVIEMSDSEIRYKLYEERTEVLVYIIEKNAVEKIEFENGKVEKFGAKKWEKVDLEEYFAGQSRRALKINFAGNFWGTTKLSYEQIIKPGQSMEAKLILITNNDGGFLAACGYKFFRKPTFIAPNMRRRNIMEGAYVKPEVFFGSVKQKGFFDSNVETETAAGLVLNLGKQWVIGKSFVLDTYVGTGIGTGEIHRGYLVGNGLVLTGGLNMGFVF